MFRQNNWLAADNYMRFSTNFFYSIALQIFSSFPWEGWKILEKFLQGEKFPLQEFLQGAQDLKLRHCF